MPFEINNIITNGSSAGKVVEHVEHDLGWKVSGVRIQNISLEAFGGNVGMTSFVPDYLASSWRKVPFEWTPIVGTAVDPLEERYVWSKDYRHISREIRRAAV